jgi:MOSC domain-containing protein
METSGARPRCWQQHLGRDDLGYGQFGENLTIDGLPDDEVCIGDRYPDQRQAGAARRRQQWSCRTGVCHTCVTPLLSGDISYVGAQVSADRDEFEPLTTMPKVVEPPGLTDPS